MKAILPKAVIHNARHLSPEKEKVTQYTVVALKNNEFCEPVTAMCWMGRSSSASVVYASIWVHGANVECSGRGSAGGYGYHKASAAIGEAIEGAGIQLTDGSKPAYISGAGDIAIEEALIAIARAAGYRKTHIVRG